MTRLYPLLPWALCVLGAVCCLSACGDCDASDPCTVRGGHYESQPAGGMTCYNFGSVTTCEPNTRSVCVGAR